MSTENDKEGIENHADSDSTGGGEPQQKKIKLSESQVQTYNKCSEGSITFHVSNAKELKFDSLTLYSQVEYINGIPWKLGIKCMPGRKLGVFLYLDESVVGSNVEVYTEYTFSLVNQVNSLKSISRPPRYDIIKSGTAYGDTSFISMDELLHHYNNFVVDNKAIFEAYITCGNLESSQQKSDLLASHSQREKELSEYMCTRVDYIMKNCIGSDCELVFVKDGEEIVKKACKAILARISPVFEKMFFRDLETKDRVNITNVEEDVFDAVLLHAYGGKCDLKSKDRTVALYLAAGVYEIKDLQHICTEYLWPRVLSDVWLFLYMSDMPELKHMKAAAVRVFSRCASEGFISEQFTRISYESLVSVVSQVAMNVRSELEVFDGIMRWAKARCTKQNLEETRENLRSVVGDALYMIRFLSMAHGEFESSPMLSCILSAEEKVLILTRLIYKKKDSSLDRLCCLVKPRLRM